MIQLAWGEVRENFSGIKIQQGFERQKKGIYQQVKERNSIPATRNRQGKASEQRQGCMKPHDVFRELCVSATGAQSTKNGTESRETEQVDAGHPDHCMSC